MAGAQDAPLYTAPSPPAPSGDAVTDVNRAWEWFQQFTTVRGYALYQMTEVVTARAIAATGG